MRIRSHIAAEAEPFAAEWAPKLLRLFHLYIGDHVAAEALTIETMSEHSNSRLRRRVSPIELLQAALAKAAKTTVAATSEEPVVRAVSSLPPDQRAAIVLFRGLMLDVETVAIIMRHDL